MSRTTLESLANELLLDIFDYLDVVPLFQAFQGLNSRLNTLIFDRVPAYHLDDQFTSKCDFDIIFQEYLSSIVDRVVSLRLSNADQQIVEDFPLRQFVGLKSLSSCRIRSVETVNEILAVLPHLPNLTQLKLIDCYVPYEDAILSIMNQIWSLPKLNYCSVDTYFGRALDVNALTVTSTSLEYLGIEIAELPFNELIHLLQQTPRLRNLRATIRCGEINGQFLAAALHVRTMNILFNGPVSVMSHLFQNTPNLRHLTLEMKYTYVNGHEWKQILIDCLPKVEVFRLKMSFYFAQDVNREEHVNGVIESFRIPFWLSERRWFVQCDWHSHQPWNLGLLYTLPYAFDEPPAAHINRSKWTSRDDDAEK